MFTFPDSESVGMTIMGRNIHPSILFCWQLSFHAHQEKLIDWIITNEAKISRIAAQCRNTWSIAIYAWGITRSYRIASRLFSVRYQFSTPLQFPSSTFDTSLWKYWTASINQIRSSHHNGFPLCCFFQAGSSLCPPKSLPRRVCLRTSISRLFLQPSQTSIVTSSISSVPRLSKQANHHHFPSPIPGISVWTAAVLFHRTLFRHW